MKERLIGAAVLTALAVWLIPILLDGPDEPIVDDRGTLELPVPSGQVGEIRTEVIDLSPRRDAAGATASPARTEAAPAARSSASGGSSARTAPDAAAATTAGGPSAADAERSAAAPDAQGGSAASGAGGGERTAAAERAASEPVRTNQTTAASRSSPAPSPTPSASAPPAAASARAPANESGDWAVQVGSFSDEANARRHAERVATFGHTPKISTFRSGGRTLYRVRIGPHATREAAEAAASALTAHGFVAQVVTTN